jgi:hypothetical protein
MMTSRIYVMLSGMAIMGCWVAGLFFIRAWRRTGDRLFLLFGAAFWILGVERMFPVLLDLSGTAEGSVYLIRLAGFSLILYAIVDKNRSRGNRRS